MDNRNMKTGADVKGYDLKNDRILQYLDEYLKGYLFVEYSDEYMKKAGVSDFMKGVRIPVSPYDLKNFAGGEGVSAEQIAENMKFVLGCNPNFRFAEAYKKYLKWVVGDRAAADSLIEGVKYVDKKEMIQACICFRTALALKPHMMEAMYNYARVCREIYMGCDDDEMMGRFKGEFIDVLEQLTLDYPDFDQPFYFLGYAYLNMGLYEKAGLAWEKFLLICKDPQAAAEVRQRLGQIADPRKIEEGCNAVISGRYQEGLITLMRFLNTGFDTWWPLHFYIATAYEETGNDMMAADEYEKTLRLNAASIDSIDGLIRIYQRAGNQEMVEKYTRKKAIIEENFRMDMEDR